MNLSGAKALMKSLEYEHVDTIFGIPGGVVIPIYDELLTKMPLRTTSCATNKQPRTRRMATREQPGK